MQDFIPFVFSEKDCTFVKKHFSDVQRVRVGLDNYPQIAPHLRGKKIWLDPTVDGCCGAQAAVHLKPSLPEAIDKAIAEQILSPSSVKPSKKARKLDWIEFVGKFKNYPRMLSESDIKNPTKQIVDEFVFSVLNECKKHEPDWISVPQLPHADDSSRNKINRLMAEATGKWSKSSDFSGQMILPAIFCSKVQLASKSSRNAKIKAVLVNMEKATADGLWAVDESLSDCEGADSFIKDRFPAVIKLHTELNSSSSMPSNAVLVAGPYWGLNLLLWSRGLIQFPAISLGTAWKYHLSGGIKMTGTPRIMIEHLRRPIEATLELKAWLEEAVILSASLPEAQDEFRSLLSKLEGFIFDRDAARNQANAGYAKWVRLISGTPEQGRAIALYQDFSKAYVLGHTLADLPIQGVGRKAGQVAKTFMLNCLGH